MKNTKQVKRAIKILQKYGYAKKKFYVPAIQQQMSVQLIIARYKKLTMKIKKTPAIENMAKSGFGSYRNLLRILKDV